MNCDFIARWYRWLEYLTFGPALQKRRREYMSAVANARHVLILGDGDGRFTAEFLTRNPAALVDSIDLSPGMMHVAERRIQRSKSGWGRARLFVADARTARLPGNYDLVVTHYFLDCFTTEEVKSLVERVAAVASPGASWLVSEFQVPGRGLRRLPAMLLVKALYLSFGILTGLSTNRLPNYAMALETGGFRRMRQTLAIGGLLVSELWSKTA